MLRLCEPTPRLPLATRLLTLLLIGGGISLSFFYDIPYTIYLVLLRFKKRPITLLKFGHGNLCNHRLYSLNSRDNWLFHILLATNVNQKILLYFIIC